MVPKVSLEPQRATVWLYEDMQATQARVYTAAQKVPWHLDKRVPTWAHRPSALRHPIDWCSDIGLRELPRLSLCWSQAEREAQVHGARAEVRLMQHHTQQEVLLFRAHPGADCAPKESKCRKKSRCCSFRVQLVSTLQPGLNDRCERHHEEEEGGIYMVRS